MTNALIERLVEVRRALKHAWQSKDPRVAFEAIVETFLTEDARNHPQLRMARQLAFGIENHRGHTNRLVEHNRTLAAKNRRSRRRLVRNVTTAHEAVDLCSVQEYEDELNNILRLLCEAVHQRAPPGALLEASLDEVEFRVTLRDKESWSKQWYAGRYCAPSIKSDGAGQQVLRFTVASLYWPRLRIKVPCFLSLETHGNKSGGATYKRAPAACDTVHEFLAKLNNYGFQPRRVYMDRRFHGEQIRMAWVTYKRRKAKEGWSVDFLSPAIRLGKANQPLALAGTLRKEGHTRKFQARRATIRQLVEHGHKVAATPMTQRPAWKYTVFEHGDPDAPNIAEGCYLTIINAQPDGLEHSGDFEEHADGSRSFANWSTEKWTPATAYLRFIGYHRRNNIERIIQDFRDRLDMIRSPDIRLRVLSVGLGFCLLGLWGLFRLQKGLELGRFEQGDYTLTHFLAELQPELSAALALILAAT